MQPKIKTFLYDIQQACLSLESFTQGKTFEEYQQDELLRAGVERKLMVSEKQSIKFFDSVRILNPGFPNLGKLLVFEMFWCMLFCR